MKRWISRVHSASGPRAGAGKGLTGMIGGAVLGVCMAASGGADAAEQFRGTEGQRISISYSLPSFPAEARRVSKGFDGVRYKICSTDYTATGRDFFGGENVPEADYFSLCNMLLEFKSRGRFEKYVKLKWPTIEDRRREGNESFWVALSDPEVKRPGGSWQRHGGSHHVPSFIHWQVIIRDND